MYIDERIIENGLTVNLIAKFINKRIPLEESLNKLMRYYQGNHDILNREMSSKGIANNKIVSNHAKYITDITTSYVCGNPISYAASEGYDIEPIKDRYIEEDIATIDFEIEKLTSIYGNAYELVYANEDGNPESVMIEPNRAFVLYSDDSRHKPLIGVYYYKSFNEDGQVSSLHCYTYDDKVCREYVSMRDDWYSLRLVEEIPHYFNAVPLFEYKNNAERQGDFEQSISLIDAYNTQMSDRVNDKENFVDAFLFLKGVEVTSEQARDLKREKILMSDIDGADAKYLSKTMSEADVKILRDDLKDDIHRLAMVPDMSDESFANNTSGVAIKYKLITFEQNIKAKEKYLTKGLKTRFALYNTLLYLKNMMQIVPVHRVDVVFTHNLPVNNLENAQMIGYLDGKVTNETLISQLDFVTDAKEESELAKEEQQTSYKEQIANVSEYATGGGYGKLQD